MFVKQTFHRTTFEGWVHTARSVLRLFEGGSTSAANMAQLLFPFPKTCTDFRTEFHEQHPRLIGRNPNDGNQCSFATPSNIIVFSRAIFLKRIPYDGTSQWLNWATLNDDKLVVRRLALARFRALLALVLFRAETLHGWRTRPSAMRRSPLRIEIKDFY